mmetsp:Transcript_61348/g.194230  ORF Transcript_61348/g.194230 Transcript_61348/m.194230 type:complete len:439 (+) Transcript_61348:95-1411(+)|eukprot:CAMPEP_0182853034 /NCGR_PEP_ID=MMETSP0034_2-20130328/483_1 /TAXON_ID=156128 /ORGANISM="Nephroselmis pyriformis, Strain CCMP717" /LENGTH=438 /DNA_ID=CAMNT_0024983781 /DNA_START=76 /DNA_END=1392 /DNA_ORIENTATION=+
MPPVMMLQAGAAGAASSRAPVSAPRASLQMNGIHGQQLSASRVAATRRTLTPFQVRAIAEPTSSNGQHTKPAVRGDIGNIKSMSGRSLEELTDSLKSVAPKKGGPGIIVPTSSGSMLGAISPSETKLRLFSGTSNPSLSGEIASYMGMDLGKLVIKRFADGEVYVQVQESIRGCDVFILQPTCPPANDNLMELLVLIDAMRRASAATITAVIPYYGYARADRKASGRESITAKLVANLLTEAGADRVIALDLHSAQCVGYFDIPVDHVAGQVVILDYLSAKLSGGTDEVVVVSPDVGGVARARGFAKRLNDAPLAIIDKRRTGHNVAEVMNLIGDVDGKVCVMVDDMIDTAGTLLKGAELLRKKGAREVYACATHAVFSPPAVERLSSDLFTEVIVTNSMPFDESRSFHNLTVLSVANLLGETIWRVHNSGSVQNIIH